MENFLVIAVLVLALLVFIRYMFEASLKQFKASFESFKSSFVSIVYMGKALGLLVA